MGINRVNKRDKVRIEVRKRWPDGTTFGGTIRTLHQRNVLWRALSGSATIFL